MARQQCKRGDDGAGSKQLTFTLCPCHRILNRFLATPPADLSRH
jgi:hypothetical protein